MFTSIVFTYFTVFSICFLSCFSKPLDYIPWQENIESNQENFDYNYYDDVVFRVVQGKPAKLGDMPYQVAFRVREKLTIYRTYCGGSIVSTSKIISAAHCFYRRYVSDCQKDGEIPRKDLSRYFAVAGTLQNMDYYQIYDSSDHGQWRALKHIFYPKNYNFPFYDIAVVFLYSPFVFNNYINAIPLASARKEYGGSCLASGYGRISSTQSSPILYYAFLPILSTEKCDYVHLRDMRHYVCTAGDVSDVQKGDSGGPLVCRNTGDPQESPYGILVGVVSGHRITHRGRSSFFTRISSYNTFINTYKSLSCRVGVSRWIFVLINVAFLLF